jgi:hypothetical protein
MFPAGIPGLALALLRIGAAGSLWEPTLETGLPGVPHLLGVGTVSALLLAGFGTHLAGAAATAVQLSRVLDALRLGILIPSEVVTAALHEYRRFRFYSWDPAHSPSTRACLDEEF